MSSKQRNKKKVNANTPVESASEPKNLKPDISHLRRPFETNIFGLEKVVELFHKSTEEVQKYLSDECEILYECRICRSIYRSLSNFIMHKREYCTNSFGNVYNSCSCYQNEIHQHLNNSPVQETAINQEANTSAITKRKNLNSILNNLVKQKELEANLQNLSVNNNLVDDKNNVKIILENVDGNSAGVFQTVSKPSDENEDEPMKLQVMEMHKIIDNQNAILASDGKIVPSEEEFNFSHGKEQTCEFCGNIFATRKSLNSHIRHKHNNFNITYPCLDCENSFVTPWGVLRHLTNVHKKSMSYIKENRHQILNKAVRISTHRANVADKPIENCDDIVKIENQEWMANLEEDSDIQMCGGCGKRFERKAALNSHSQICSKRKAVCDARIKPRVKVIHNKIISRAMSRKPFVKIEQDFHDTTKLLKLDLKPELSCSNEIPSAEKNVESESDKNKNSSAEDKNHELFNAIQEIIGLPIDNKPLKLKQSVQNELNEARKMTGNFNRKEIGSAKTVESKAINTNNNSGTSEVSSSTKSTVNSSNSSSEELLSLLDVATTSNNESDPDEILEIKEEDLDCSFTSGTDGRRFCEESNTNENYIQIISDPQNLGIEALLETGNPFYEHEGAVIYDDEIKIEEHNIIDYNQESDRKDITHDLWNIDLLEDIKIYPDPDYTGKCEKTKGEEFNVINPCATTSKNEKNIETLNSPLPLPSPTSTIAVCAYCQSEFPDQHAIQSHINTSHNCDKFQCIKCNFVTNCKESGILHASNKHSAEIGEDIILPIPEWKFNDCFNRYSLRTKDDSTDKKNNENQITDNGNKDLKHLTDRNNKNNPKLDGLLCTASSSEISNINLRKYIFNVILGTEENPEKFVKLDVGHRPARIRNRCVKKDFVYDPVVKRKKSFAGVEEINNEPTFKGFQSKSLTQKKRKRDDDLNKILEQIK